MHFHRHVENLIANLRGLPEDYSSTKVRPSIELGNLIEVIEHQHPFETETLEGVIMQNWRQIVGEGNAYRCCPQRLTADGRKLVITAANPVIRQELLFRKRQLLDRIRALPRASAILDLVIRTQ